MRRQSAELHLTNTDERELWEHLHTFINYRETTLLLNNLSMENHSETEHSICSLFLQGLTATNGIVRSVQKKIISHSD